MLPSHIFLPGSSCGESSCRRPGGRCDLVPLRRVLLPSRCGVLRAVQVIRIDWSCRGRFFWVFPNPFFHGKKKGRKPPLPARNEVGLALHRGRSSTLRREIAWFFSGKLWHIVENPAWRKQSFPHMLAMFPLIGNKKVPKSVHCGRWATNKK